MSNEIKIMKHVENVDAVEENPDSLSKPLGVSSPATVLGVSVPSSPFSSSSDSSSSSASSSSPSCWHQSYEIKILINYFLKRAETRKAEQGIIINENR
jgi:hypothetical protein